MVYFISELPIGALRQRDRVRRLPIGASIHVASGRVTKTSSRYRERPLAIEADTIDPIGRTGRFTAGHISLGRLSSESRDRATIPSRVQSGKHESGGGF